MNKRSMISGSLDEEKKMVLFPNQTVAHPSNVREHVQKEFRRQAGEAGTGDGTDQCLWDKVDQASWESFPASDAPPWTLGYTGPRAAG